MTSFAAGKRSRRDAACAFPAGSLRKAKRKPLENVGIFSGIIPETARASPALPFCTALFAFLVPLWTKFLNHSRKKEKAFVRRRTFRLPNGARRDFSRRYISLLSLKRLAFQTANFPSGFGRTLVLWQSCSPLPRGAGILGSLAAMHLSTRTAGRSRRDAAIARALFL